MSINKKTMLNREKKANPPPKGRWKSHKACPIEMIKEMARLGHSNNVIAQRLGISPDNLTMNFSDVLAHARIDGDHEILKSQMDKAVGKTTKGDNTLLMYLGKTRLHQREEAPEVSNNQSLANKLFETWNKDAKDLQGK